ncbi:MAG TPA: HutD family protein [Candidatus Blautia merdipullorum]|nr:HutD family protein [Candidatus Blautia merdipullorum]
MKNNIIVRTEKDYKVSKWSGGDTTELYLYPEDGDYRSGNFQLRISSATVEVERSEFTSLPGVERYLMIFQGHLDMIHGEKEKVSLEPYEVDHFDGGIPTVSYGKVVDFNLMLKNGAGGRIEALCLDKGEEKRIQPEGRENFLAIYVKEGEIRIGDKNIKAQELGVIKDWKTELQIRSRAEKNSKLGICRAEI